MAIGFGIAQPKPEARKRVKARRKRQAAKVVKSIRAQCVERDGSCRFESWEDHPDDFHSDALEGICDGPAEWAHLGAQKRFKTRGQPPTHRHTTAGSLIVCRAIHRAYDEGRIAIEPQTELGADGPLTFRSIR